MTSDPVASRRFDELVDTAELQVEPVTHHQARIARDAYRDFGKGSGHKAGLNFGDCFAYALAKSIVADAGRSGQRVLVGSQNFSVASLGYNRELGILTSDPRIVTAIAATLAHDYAGAP